MARRNARRGLPTHALSKSDMLDMLQTVDGAIRMSGGDYECTMTAAMRYQFMATALKQAANARIKPDQLEGEAWIGIKTKLIGDFQ